jgi:hypothetical protein
MINRMYDLYVECVCATCECSMLMYVMCVVCCVLCVVCCVLCVVCCPVEPCSSAVSMLT